VVMLQTHGHDKAPGVWRPFGCAEDLDVDFTTKDRPALVTMLLASCGSPRETDFWWSQAVAVRIVALLRLLAATDSIDHLGLLARCRQPECMERFEFELPIAALSDDVPEGDTIQVRLKGERSIVLRRPNGRDLSEWRNLRPQSRRAAIDAMIGSLVVEGHVSPEDEPVLAEALSVQDPLVAFTVSCACPACGSTNEVGVDLEDIVLVRLRRKQRALVRDVHRLASHYGWTEAEVLAIPPHRRTQYLTMIENER
jgi:hypothetical protein